LLWEKGSIAAVTHSLLWEDRMPKLRHYDNLGTVRFVTLCCYHFRPYMNNDLAKALFIKHLEAARVKHGFRLLAYVIMPEHVHLVLLPPDGMKLGLVIREIKSKMAREYFSTAVPEANGERIFWQKRCYDHNCRTPDTVREKIVYCHNNPVKRGLAPDPEAYSLSSYSWYLGRRDVPLQMDGYEL
jgi:putative transposase